MKIFIVWRYLYKKCSFFFGFLVDNAYIERIITMKADATVSLKYDERRRTKKGRPRGGFLVATMEFESIYPGIYRK